MGDVQIAEDRNQGEHHAADREYQLSFEAHVIHESNSAALAIMAA
jgi:hypothetical protein